MPRQPKNGFSFIMSLGVPPGCEADVLGSPQSAHPKSAGPWRIRRGGGGSRFVKTTYRHQVAVAVMSDEFPRDIAVNAAKHWALPRGLNSEAGASAELGNRGND